MFETSEALRQQLLLGLRGYGIDAEGVNGAEGARRLLQEEAASGVEVVILGPDAGALRDLLPQAARPFAVPAVALARDVDAGLRAIREGATDFVLTSTGAEGLALAIRKLQARRVRGDTPPAQAEVPAGGGADDSAAGGSTFVSPSRPPLSPSRPPLSPPAPAVLVGGSAKIASVLALIARLAPVRTAVLIGGESGTGKELVAQALHDQSTWRRGPFVAVNCGAIPAGLIESELFGHVRGSFTDAVRDKQGLFQAAHGGTLFLDEIADLPWALQSKLLRVAQDGVMRRVGDSEDLRVEVRLVAATARDLSVEVAAGRFREDLYYRLAGLIIQLPPLRERAEDIPALAVHFLARARARLGVKARDIDAEALRLLAAYPWPGNVRELENTIERAAVLCADDRIDVASLPERMVSGPAALGFGGGDGNSAARPGSELGSLSIKQAARRTEQDLIRRALAVTGGNRTRAAELLEISHRALLYKIKEYGIQVPRTVKA